MTAENECSASGRVKHVDIKFRFVQESVKMGEIRIRYISTELNWTDVLTKALLPKKHKGTIESIVGSKEAFRLVVTEKGALIQYVRIRKFVTRFTRLQGSTTLSPVHHMMDWILVLVQKDSNPKNESFYYTEP
jgi:hypothetical protein